MSLGAEQQRVLDAVASGRNVFFSGVAGTGKSFTLAAIKKLLKDRGKSFGVTAPTGAAAIGISGETLHGFAGAGVPCYANDFKKMWGGGRPRRDNVVGIERTEQPKKEKTAKWRSLDVLIIDEIGMVPAEFLDWMDATVREIRGPPQTHRYGCRCNLHCPVSRTPGSSNCEFNKVFSVAFGGIQLVVCGDFSQLPPVPGSPLLSLEPPDVYDNGTLVNQPPRKRNYNETAAPIKASVPVGRKETTALCFQSAFWRDACFVPIRLTEVFRQSEAAFLAALSDLREGRGDSEAVLSLVHRCNRPLSNIAVVGPESSASVGTNAAVGAGMAGPQSGMISAAIEPTVLYCTKVNVEAENMQKLASLPGDMKILKARDSVMPSPVHEEEASRRLWNDTFFKEGSSEAKAPSNLELKVGAQVILTANEIANREMPANLRLVNGSRGVLVGFATVQEYDTLRQKQNEMMHSRERTGTGANNNAARDTAADAANSAQDSGGKGSYSQDSGGTANSQGSSSSHTQPLSYISTQTPPASPVLTQEQRARAASNREAALAKRQSVNGSSPASPVLTQEQRARAASNRAAALAKRQSVNGSPGKAPSTPSRPTPLFSSQQSARSADERSTGRNIFPETSSSDGANVDESSDQKEGQSEGLQRSWTNEVAALFGRAKGALEELNDAERSMMMKPAAPNRPGWPEAASATNERTGATESTERNQQLTAYPIVAFANGRTKLVGPHAFDREIYFWGTCVRVQVPLLLAWAQTVHKAQGASLDLVVVDLQGCFAPGQAYVALSRARSMEGLEVRNYRPDRIKVSPLASRFFSALVAATTPSPPPNYSSSSQSSLTSSRESSSSSSSSSSLTRTSSSSSFSLPPSDALQNFVESIALWWYPVTKHPGWLKVWRAHPTFKAWEARFGDDRSNAQDDDSYSQPSGTSALLPFYPHAKPCPERALSGLPGTDPPHSSGFNVKTSTAKPASAKAPKSGTCFECGREGHRAKHCPIRPSNTDRSELDDDTDDSDIAVVDVVPYEVQLQNDAIKKGVCDLCQSDDEQETNSSSGEERSEDSDNDSRINGGENNQDHKRPRIEMPPSTSPSPSLPTPAVHNPSSTRVNSQPPSKRRQLCDLDLADATLVMRRAELMRQVADLDDQREALAADRAALQREGID